MLGNKACARCRCSNSSQRCWMGLRSRALCRPVTFFHTKLNSFYSHIKASSPNRVQQPLNKTDDTLFDVYMYVQYSDSLTLKCSFSLTVIIRLQEHNFINLLEEYNPTACENPKLYWPYSVFSQCH